MSDSIACIDFRDGKVLIAKRLNVGEMGNRWEFPGGKIEDGENYEQAIKREIAEEFSCDVQVYEKIANGSFLHKNKECTVTAFRVHFEKDGINENFILTEHSQIKWEKIENIDKLNFVDSDLNLLPQIKKALDIN